MALLPNRSAWSFNSPEADNLSLFAGCTTKQSFILMALTRRTSLRQRFDWIVTRVPALSNSTKPPPGHANMDELLRVLDRPDIPLHTNGTENAVRSFVTKRRIS